MNGRNVKSLEEINSIPPIDDMDKLMREIASYIIKEVQTESTGFEMVVGHDIIQQNFALKINVVVNELILDALCNREEVADVEEDSDGYSVVLYTGFAPNYEPEEED